MRNYLHTEEKLSLVGFWSCGKAEEKLVRKFVGKWWESFTQGCGKAHLGKKMVGKSQELHMHVENFTEGFARGLTSVRIGFCTFST